MNRGSYISLAFLDYFEECVGELALQKICWADKDLEPGYVEKVYARGCAAIDKIAADSPDLAEAMKHRFKVGLGWRTRGFFSANDAAAEIMRQGMADE